MKSAYFGTLTTKESEKFQAYVSESREEWNSNIWIDTNVLIDRRSDESSAKGRLIFFGKNH